MRFDKNLNILCNELIIILIHDKNKKKLYIILIFHVTPVAITKETLLQSVPTPITAKIPPHCHSRLII